MNNPIKLSIIIPALNEEESLSRLIPYLKKHVNPAYVEIMIVDGGSKDKTEEVGRSHEVAVYASPEKGRAKQMNFGAKKAKGDVLYFLHSDTLPPKNFIDIISREVGAKTKAGCFQLKFDDDHPVLSFYSWFTRFDIDFFRFGDQSLFVEKALFQKAGGFGEDLLVMEDQEIVTRLKYYAQFSVVGEHVITSARKYQRFGVFRLQMIFTIIVVLFYLRISQEAIANFYKSFLRTGLH